MARWILSGAVALLIAASLVLSAQSPLLAWRQPVYIAAGFAGVLAMGLLLIQPILMIAPMQRQWHRWVGIAVVAAVMVHVGGLWVTSPPDVVDVLLLRSPTPFGLWGALAFYALVITALLALRRRRLGWRWWTRMHIPLALIIAVGTVLHAVLIEGAMESVSKWALAFAICLASAVVLAQRGRTLRRNRS